MKFTSKQHESNFLDLMVMDNTYHDDKVSIYPKPQRKNRKIMKFKE